MFRIFLFMKIYYWVFRQTGELLEQGEAVNAGVTGSETKYGKYKFENISMTVYT